MTAARDQGPPVAVVVIADYLLPADRFTLAPEDWAELGAAMVADRCAQVAKLRGVVLAIGFAGDRLPANLAPEGFEPVRCEGHDLGEKLVTAAEHFLSRGFPAILVDSDSPTLPLAYLQSAVESLRAEDPGHRCDVVFGAAEDGGYYLIGLRQSTAELFRDMPWNTNRLANATLARVAELGLTLHRLPDWWDVDQPEDLTRLRRSLLRSWWPSHTARWLREGEARARELAAPTAAPAERWRASWQRLSSRAVYDNPWLSLREDLVRMPDGNHTLYGVIDTGECVGVLPFADRDTVLMVRQYRYVFDRVMLEMPTGGVDPGESVEEAARRELAEEARVEAGHLEYLGAFHTNKSVMNEVAHLYTARDLTPARVVSADDTEFLRVEEVRFERVLGAVLSGEILDGMTIIAVLRAARTRDQAGRG